MHVLVRAYMYMHICVHNYVYTYCTVLLEIRTCTAVYAPVIQAYHIEVPPALAGPIDQYVGEISSYLLWPTVFHSSFESFPRSQLQFKQVAMATTMAGYKEEAALSMHTEANTYPS